MATRQPYKWTEEKKNFIRERLNEKRTKVKKEFTERFGAISVDVFYAQFSHLRPGTGIRTHNYSEGQNRWLEQNSRLSVKELEQKFRRSFPATNISGPALLRQRSRRLDPNRNNAVQWNDEKDLYLLESMRDKIPSREAALHLGLPKTIVEDRKVRLKVEYGEDLAGAIRTRQMVVSNIQPARPPRQIQATPTIAAANELLKQQTGISAELLVAGELSRRGFNVAITFGNTKAIDLLADKDGRMVAVQVKGIQKTTSICWNVSLDKIKQFKKDKTYDKVIYVLVNLHADTLKAPEYFILTSTEMLKHVKPVNSGRDYIDYNLVKRLKFQDKWQKV